MDKQSGAIMNTAGLFLILTLLLSRIQMTSWDNPVKWQQVLRVGFPQLFSIILFEHYHQQLMLAIMIVIINSVWFYFEWKEDRREQFSSLHLQTIRLWILLASICGLIVIASPVVGISFRDLHSVLSRIQYWFLPIGLIEQAPWRKVFIIGVGFLLCLNEVNLVIRNVIERLQLKPQGQEFTQEDRFVINSEYKRGRVIGILERTIIFSLVFSAQYGALGFILAAKTMTRFKNLEDREFAEYFLVGTLLSLAVAGMLALIARKAVYP